MFNYINVKNCFSLWYVTRRWWWRFHRNSKCDWWKFLFKPISSQCTL